MCCSVLSGLSYVSARLHLLNFFYCVMMCLLSYLVFLFLITSESYGILYLVLSLVAMHAVTASMSAGRKISYSVPGVSLLVIS